MKATARQGLTEMGTEGGRPGGQVEAMRASGAAIPTVELKPGLEPWKGELTLCLDSGLSKKVVWPDIVSLCRV